MRNRPLIATTALGLLLGGACTDTDTSTGIDTPIVRVGKLAFVSNRDGNNEVYLMNADGSGLTQLTNSPAIDAQPAWSPDGKKIAFVSDRDGKNDIYVINTDGSDQARLTSGTARNFQPEWR